MDHEFVTVNIYRKLPAIHNRVQRAVNPSIQQMFLDSATAVIYGVAERIKWDICVKVTEDLFRDHMDGLTKMHDGL